MPLRLYFIAAAVVAVAVLLGALKLEHDAKVKAEARAKQAEAQAALNASAVQTVDHYTRETRIIREKSEGAVHVVETAVGAETPVLPDVLGKWKEAVK